jgi:hypothetical protein
MRALCYHYGVELHNFTPNAISQAATFVGVCEGFLGIPVNWDIWVHLFRVELHTLTTPELKIRRAVRAGGMTIALRNMRRELYIPYTMTSNNSEWERGWFYLRNDGASLPSYSGKVLKDKADSWHHGVSPPSHQTRLDSLLAALKDLADDGLTAGCVLANLYHRRVVPLMERPLRIFEMHEDADPAALAQSRLLPGLFPREYTATRARRAIDLRTGRNDDATLWAFTMLPVGPLVSGFPLPLVLLVRGASACLEILPVPLQIRAVNAARSDPPTPGLEHTRAPHSGGSRSGRPARGSRAFGDGSAGNGGVRSFGCASSRGSTLRGPRSTLRQARRRRKAMGAGLPPIGGSPRPPRPEPRRRQRRRCLGRAQERPPPGHLRERRRAPWKCQRAPRRRLGVRRWPHRWRRQRLPSPRGKGKGVFPP